MSDVDIHGAAAGTGLNLVEACPRSRDASRPDDPTDGQAAIALAFSGGGFRASLAALGVVRLLEDLDLLKNVRFVSSVSGGSVAAGMLATRWDDALAKGVDKHLIDPFVKRISSQSLKWAIVKNLWRTVGSSNRTDLLAYLFDKWWFDDEQMEDLSPDVRWIINAANQTTGVRFGFERDRIGDYVCGYVANKGSGVKVSEAAAASAAVPGPFPALQLPESITFGCPDKGRPRLVDGGAYDNTGLTALEPNTYNSAFTIALNAGGLFQIGASGKIPIVRDLQLANSMLYRQSTALRTQEMVSRFMAWERATADPERPMPGNARPGVLFALATSFSKPRGKFPDWQNAFPEHRTWDDDGTKKDLALVPTVFDKLDELLCRQLVYRGWWLAGAALSSFYPDLVDVAKINQPPKLT